MNEPEVKIHAVMEYACGEREPPCGGGGDGEENYEDDFKSRRSRPTASPASERWPPGTGSRMEQ